ncbi:MAG: hypothetical protein Q4C37_07460 [Bacteroidales bacterium]|nr:hypothetical protein [Bacteroidales bacterium]
MNRIKILFVALIATLALASCSEDEPPAMLWEVYATPSENVNAAFDPSFYTQIQITSDGEGGEVTLRCTNYKNLQLSAKQNDNGEYVVEDFRLRATVTEPDVIKIILDKMPEDFEEKRTILYIYGTNGVTNTTGVSIVRKP